MVVRVPAARLRYRPTGAEHGRIAGSVGKRTTDGSYEHSAISSGNIRFTWRVEEAYIYYTPLHRHTVALIRHENIIRHMFSVGRAKRYSQDAAR